MNQPGTAPVPPAHAADRPGLGIWLQLLIALLFVWHPIAAGAQVANAIDAIARRGVLLALILAVRIVITGAGIAAGLAMLGRSPAARPLAVLAMAASGVLDLFVYLSPYVPSNRYPGTTPWYVGASLAYHLLWLGYLLRSRRVRRAL